MAVIKSNITGRTYDLDFLNGNVRSPLYLCTPNMLQCYCYLYQGCDKALVDIVCGENHKMYFVWDRQNEMFKRAHNLWCLHTWEDEVGES